MTTLADLTREGWTPVAVRVRMTETGDTWEWLLPPRDVSVLHIAREHGSVLTAQQRYSNGSLVLVARLARARGAPGPEAFALAGRGMFEQ